MRRAAIAILVGWGLLVALAAFAGLHALAATTFGAVSGGGATTAAPVTIPQASARYRIALQRAAASQFGVDAPIARLAAQIHQESAWRPNAESPYAQGIAQFTPSTAAWLPSVCPDVGPPDAWDASWSIRAMACYDRYLFERVVGAAACDQWAFTLSAYNGGLGWVARDMTRASANGADPALWFDNVERFSARSTAARAENRAYVRRILLVIEPAYIAAGWPGLAMCS